MITVNHFGLHWIEGDIGLLVQQNRVDHVLPVATQFEVTTLTRHRGLMCPHDIHLDEDQHVDLPDDDLFRAFLPLPKEFGDKALFVEETIDNLTIVRQLLRLSGGGTMFPLWGMRPAIADAMLHLTNLQPLVLFGYHIRQQVVLNKILQSSFMAPRRLVVIGPRWTVLRDEAERVDVTFSSEDLQDLPLERAGASVLREHMMRKP